MRSDAEVLARGQRATALLEDETLIEVFATLCAQYHNEWELAGELAEREDAWYKVQALRDVQQGLRVIAQDGEVIRTRELRGRQ